MYYPCDGRRVGEGEVYEKGRDDVEASVTEGLCGPYEGGVLETDTIRRPEMKKGVPGREGWKTGDESTVT